jgi:hypothetical protein
MTAPLHLVREAEPVTPARVPHLLCPHCQWTGISFHHFHAHDCEAHRRSERRFERFVVAVCVLGLVAIAAGTFVLNAFYPAR